VSTDLKRTMFADKAVAAAEMFDIRYGKRDVGDGRRRLALGEPDGPSTDGGRKARQPIVLGGADGRSAVVGFLDVAKLKVELRPHAVIAEAWQTRWHEPIDVSRGEWAPLVADMNEFFVRMGYEVKLVEAPRAAPSPLPAPARVAPRPASSGGGLVLLAVVGGGVILFLAVVGAVALLR